ncbi:hypothetical protein [Streptomyces sp. NBC_01268]|uniref:hypothetical protein n=1 Tax=Streptomyces sp. NBC_01268 TaxID=2903806 RepID=UPI002E2ECA80|nr:hypothetical protein [Streptomyces sp. NBC_01268]
MEFRTSAFVEAADEAYPSLAIREHLRNRGIQAALPAPADQRGHRLRRDNRGGGAPPGNWGGASSAFDREAYEQRNTVDRCVSRLKHWRGIDTRHEQTATVRSAGVHVAGILLWSSR